MYAYTWYQWLAFFYLYCFLGWVFESCYVSLRKGHFVNRGFLRLPLLPLYGSGAVMMLVVSIPFMKNLVLTWFAGVLGATLLEYVTGYGMELLFKVRYWDYSDQRFNLNGYICLSSSIAWGFLTILMTHGIHRPVERVILSLPPLWSGLLVSLLSAVFLYDAAISTRDALAFGKALEALKRLHQDLDTLQLQTSLLRMEARERIQTAKAELARLRSRSELRLENLHEKTEKQLAELLHDREERISALLSGRLRLGKKLLSANPSMRSRRYARELASLRDYIKNGRNEHDDRTL
ncbi:MAG: DUF1204 domain-containing protein [Lachnospiraceae bacterium]|jgi:uncharacterized membrane protein|nr:DUF1204 domain-containing protein [Lachnospiraceae bacterium]